VKEGNRTREVSTETEVSVCRSIYTGNGRTDSTFCAAVWSNSITGIVMQQLC